MKRILSSRAARLLAALLMTAVVVPPPSLRAQTRLDDDLEGAKARLMELERDFELVVEEYNLVHEDLTSIQVRIGLMDKEVDEIRHRMSRKRTSAVALARELYKAGPSVAIEAVLAAQDLGELEAGLQYLQTSRTQQSQVFERLAADQSLLDDKLVLLERAEADALAKERRLGALREEIEGKVAEQRDEIAELNAAIERIERQRAERLAAAAAAATTAPVDIGEIARRANPSARVAVEAALSQLGKPYQWGAAGPDSYDCSGLTMWAWAHAGVSLPHNSGAQYAATPRVARSDWQPGDLLFFGSPIHHVGMYIGDGQMVEAPYTGSQVRIVSASRTDYVGAGRPGV
ncbi:MAG TPA: NlpC/P60 family protein [Actinomycetota bacterium]|nr:NlpC/P60 family protein [Actinomycetota bacterium]